MSNRKRRSSPFVLALRKLAVSGFVVISFAAYAIHERLIGANSADVTLPPDNTTGQTQLMSNTEPLVPTVVPAVPTSQQVEPTLQQVQQVQQAAPTDQPLGQAVQQSVPNSPLLLPTNTPFIPTATPIPPTATTRPQGQYADGVYTGPTVDAFYGLVQVQATVTGGRLSDVKFLQFPNDRRTSQQINSIAMPYLIREAVQAQSAYINIISGATLTSQAFAQSLYNALNQAKNS